MKAKRPFGVTLLAVAVLLLAAWNAGQAAVAARDMSFMQSQGASAPGSVLIVTGVTWAIGFVIAALGLWRLKAWGRHWTLIAIVAYQLQVWIGRLTLERSSYEALTRPAALALSISSMALVWFILFLPKIRRVFDTQHAPRNTEQS
ncbi:hypothetical protein GPROT1_04154 [Gammaproteobacteria bacterium]|nr:hypothetical protein GPROT1_04154 [Gammaproteobacteria bacterium]